MRVESVPGPRAHGLDDSRPTQARSNLGPLLGEASALPPPRLAKSVPAPSNPRYQGFGRIRGANAPHVAGHGGPSVGTDSASRRDVFGRSRFARPDRFRRGGGRWAVGGVPPPAEDCRVEGGRHRSRPTPVQEITVKARAPPKAGPFARSGHVTQSRPSNACVSRRQHTEKMSRLRPPSVAAPRPPAPPRRSRGGAGQSAAPVSRAPGPRTRGTRP